MILKELNHKNYTFKLNASEELTSYNYFDATLEILKNNIIVKEYKVKHDFEFYYKIQKTQIKASNIYQLFDKINDDVSVSKIFFDKLILTI